MHQHGIIITTGDFSKSARAEANAPGKAHIGLINGAKLVELLIKHQVGVTNRRLDVIALDEEYWGEFAGANQDKMEAEVNPAKTEPGVQAQQTPHEGPSAKKQITYTLFDRQHTATLWRDVLVDVCAALAAQHGLAFAKAAFTVKGRTRQYVAPGPDGMIAPAQIPGTELWVEAKWTSSRRPTTSGTSSSTAPTGRRMRGASI